MESKAEYYQIRERCPVCSSEDAKIIQFETISSQSGAKKYLAPYDGERVFQKWCKKCDFIYHDRIPKDPGFFIAQYNEMKRDYERDFRCHGKDLVFQQAKKIIIKYMPSGALLDIGAWCGTFMMTMRHRYKVIGYDLNESAAAFGRTLGLDIRSDPSTLVKLPSGSFDVITLIDVLEHIPSPKELIARCLTLLKAGGVIYIKLPNSKPQIMKERLKKMLGFDIAGLDDDFEHINHFSHKSLAQLLDSAGFRVLEKGYAKPVLINLSKPRSIYRKVKKSLFNVIKFAGSRLAAYLSMTKLIDVGFNIYIIAKKS